MAKKTTRNGKIEFLRFVFCLVVMFFHFSRNVIGLDYQVFGIEAISFFSKGYFGVEFFFVVSGFLMAAAAFKNKDNGVGFGRDAFNFMQKKLMGILPFHLIAYTVTFVGFFFLYEYSLKEAAVKLFESLPNFFLISRSGLPVTDILGVEWYLSDMLIAMVFLYPLCRRYYDVFSKVIAPVAAIMILGYIMKTTGTLSGTSAWSVLFSKTLLRAVAELCAGVFVFELCRNVKKLNFTRFDKMLLTVVEFGCYIAVLCFTTIRFPGKFGAHFLILLCLGVCISFSDLSYGKKLFNTRFFGFLGSLSLPLYLCHIIAVRFVSTALTDVSDFSKFLVFIGISFGLTFVLMPVEKVLHKLIDKKLHKLGGV